MIDLHTHSTASDGSLTPTELICLAHSQGIVALALTDHDTVAGLPEAIIAASACGLNFIPGLEISLEGPSPKHPMHLLGLWVDQAAPLLQEQLHTLQKARHQRNLSILTRFHDLGLPLDWEEVEALSGGEQMGRPHFALALLKRGWVRSLAEAFQRYLGRGKSAYVPKFRLSPPEGIKLLRNIGAVPVLAHPCSLKMSLPVLKRLLLELKGYGLAGLEVYYSEHTPAQTKQYASLAKSLGLSPSGGSDFHGQAKPRIFLGRGHGNLTIPPEILDELEERRAIIRAALNSQS